MKKLSKVSAIITAAVMCVICMALPANALTFDKNAKKNAQEISFGREYKKIYSAGEEKYYKTSLKEKGELSWDIDFECPTFYIYVFDGNGKEVCAEHAKGNRYDEYEGEIKGSVTLEKGTYYILLKRGSDSVKSCSGEAEAEFGFNAAAASSAVSITEDMLALYLEEGDDLYIGALIGGKEAAAVKFSSSDEKVARVSEKGKLRAVRKGQAVITVTSGKKTLKLAVIVTEDD